MTPPLQLVTFGGLGIQRGGAPAAGAGAQRRRLALLALLAAAGERGLSREKLLSLLWPESDLERARKNLAQAVYALRRDLGAEDLVLGTTDLRLNPDLCDSDLARFRQALKEQRLADAVALYQGPFLDGIYLDEAPEFERWAETERTALAHDYIAALERLAQDTSAAGDPRAAVSYWRLLANADPLNAKSALGLMRALASAGDRAAALQHYRVYEMLLRQELELEPEPEVKRLADQLREAGSGDRAPFGSASARPGGERVREAVGRTVGRSDGPDTLTVRPSDRSTALPAVPVSTIPGTPAVTRPAPVPEPSGRKLISGYTDEYARPRPVPERAPVASATAVPPYRPTAKPFLKRTSTRLGIAIGVVLGLVLAGVLRVRVFRDRMGAGVAAPVVAVGMIKDYTRSGEGLARPLGDMLATDLARSRSLQVISTARMYELMAQAAGGTGDSAASAVRAARAAGATELLDGALYRRPDGRLRLDLNRTSLATGSVIESYSAESGDLFGLVEEARRSITAGLDSTASGSIAEVTTRSLVAYRFYEEGLRALFRGDGEAGARLMEQALQEDSTFAMAAYWLATTQGSFNDVSLIRGLERAVRLSARASERERLTILAGWSAAVDAPNRIAIAESLTVRYPNEPEGYTWLAGARNSSGDFLGAVEPLRKVIRMDSLSLRASERKDGPPVRCHACIAYLMLIGTYDYMDSLPAAIRTAEEWQRAQPQAPGPAGQISWQLMLAGRYREALTADQAVIARDPGLVRDGFRVQVWLRMGNFAAADSYYTQLAHGKLPGEGYKWLSLSHRMQGKPREGLEWAHRLRALDTQAPRGAAPYNALFEGQAWYELGEFRRAAAIFDSVSRSPKDTTRSQVARNLVWTQLLRSTALAAAGDTAPLPRIADSLQVWGQRNSYGRDGRAHHHVRGLLYAARGQLDQAAAEFRQAIWSPTSGYTRTNIELAKVLLRLNRPREAAYWTDAARRGGLDASQTYATTTELLELGALAWDAAGERDSAVTRYRQVLQNWRDAEPIYRARVERARIRVAQLGGN
ncbi:MAG: winged helix-turn-helix domain-containing protein [Gemmatimonadetes bacterium]|nr:winged helix-turn-helix domain-containing protein [Gemmatimonadota bacterium]